MLTGKEKQAYMKQLAEDFALREEAQLVAFLDAFPYLAEFVLKPPEDFRALSIFIAKDGGYLAIAKRFGAEGKKEIIFAHGDTPYKALQTTDQAMQRNFWKEDKDRPRK